MKLLRLLLPVLYMLHSTSVIAVQETASVLTLDPGERAAVHAQVLQGKRSQESKDVATDLLLSVRVRPNENNWNWSGPLCLASLGLFCVRVRRSSSGFSSMERGNSRQPNEKGFWFASANCQEESSSLVMHVRSQSSGATPYRIENALHSKTILYQQKVCHERCSVSSVNLGCRV